MKQTAVEWLEEELKGVYESDYFNKLLVKAKAMEKEQHQETFNQARLAKIYEKDMTPVWDSWYQYYNITFKSE